MSFLFDKDKKNLDGSEFKMGSIDDKLTNENKTYNTPLEYLLDELLWLNRIIAIKVMQLRCVNFYEDIKDFKNLFITDKEVDELLSEEGRGGGKHQDDEIHYNKITRLQQLAHTMRDYIDNRVLISLQQDQVLPLVQLKNLFGLSIFDIEILIICIAPYIDARYERLYAYLQNDINKKLPSRDLIIELLLAEDKSKTDYISAFDKSSPLIYYGLLIDNGNEFESQQVNSQFLLDPRIVQYALCNQAVDEQLAGKLRLLQPLPWDQVIVSDKLKIRLQKFINYEFSHHGDVCLYIHGNTGVGKKTIAQALCSDLQVLFTVVDLNELLHAQENFEQTVKRVLREGLLQPCAVCFDHVEVLDKQEIEMPGFTNKFIQLLRETSWLTFLCSENPLPSVFLQLARVYPIEIKRPKYEEQILLWQQYLGNTSVDCGLIEIPSIAARFDLSGGQIVRSVQEAEKIAHIRDPDNSQLTYNELVKCCRLQSQPKLMSLAKKIDPQYCWQDLVLPEDQMTQLQEMVNQVTHRHKVLDE